jgi:hypothetical protein
VAHVIRLLRWFDAFSDEVARSLPATTKDMYDKPSLKQQVSRGLTGSACDPHRDILGSFQCLLVACVASNRILLRESMTRSLMSPIPKYWA